MPDNLRGQLETTDTGRALLFGRVVIPVGTERTDTVGALQGEINAYKDGVALTLQVFLNGVWYEISLQPPP